MDSVSCMQIEKQNNTMLFMNTYLRSKIFKICLARKHILKMLINLRRCEKGKRGKLVGRGWEINYTKKVGQSLKQLWHKVIAGW